MSLVMSDPAGRVDARGAVIGALTPEALWVGVGLLGLLLVASAVSAGLARRGRAGDRGLRNLVERTRAWWAMVGLFFAAAAAGRGGVTVLFLAVSLLALREMLALTGQVGASEQSSAVPGGSLRGGSHDSAAFAGRRGLAAGGIALLQYALVHAGWYGMFAIFIPVWVFLLVAVSSAVAGGTRGYHERVAKHQWALMSCVYFVSHAPALLTLQIRGFAGRNLDVLLFLVLVVQLGDVLQYVWGKLAGRRPLMPRISPGKTVEGLVGGGLSAAAVGTALWWLTPFTPAGAFGLSLALVAAGFFGGLVMSAVKRDAGVKDWSALIPGHGGMLDRIDSLCFAAPVGFHLVRYFHA